MNPMLEVRGHESSILKMYHIFQGLVKGGISITYGFRYSLQKSNICSFVELPLVADKK